MSKHKTRPKKEFRIGRYRVQRFNRSSWLVYELRPPTNKEMNKPKNIKHGFWPNLYLALAHLLDLTAGENAESAQQIMTALENAMVQIREAIEAAGLEVEDGEI